MYISNYRRRFNAVFFLFYFILVLCVGRLLFIQFFRGNYLVEIAKKQHNLFIELEPRRGTIFDASLKPQGINISVDSVYASPNEMPEKTKAIAVQKLALALKIPASEIREKLSRKKSFVWLARKIPSSQSALIKAFNLRGIDFLKESKRCYPNSFLAAHIIGFAGLDNAGLEGLELSQNRFLKGEPGWAWLLRDARQKKLDLTDRMMPAKDGYDVVLTIDEVIQYIAEREIDKAFKQYHAKGACIIVMDPHTGAILALANRPTYDLNNYQSSDKDSRRNRAVADFFEPGSVFKIVTASAALEENRVTESTRIFCENGSYRVANHILHDHESKGTLTFQEVIEQSSNIGTVKVAQMLGPAIVYKYAKLFGFGTKTGVDLPGEISGVIKDPKFWSKTSIGAVPMGQEVGVTALQLSSAMCAIANGGMLMRPYIIKEIRDKFGEPIKQYGPQQMHRAISEKTALRMRLILQGVVEHGTGKLAQVNGYTSGGKTGTAQKVENGAYSHNKFVGSFIGFAPAEDPVLVVGVTLDDPHPLYYGGVVSSPVFKNVVGDVLRYLKITQQVAQSNEALNQNNEVNPAD
ncbi:MAG TPA: penicillin-binding transpeptidase domain-containing protein [Candidatus Omnitrophota bacterium]|nr:penicillin-binding transpeptidase domain-containing protein [Candidatus Omnitrophota bacterium]